MTPDLGTIDLPRVSRDVRVIDPETGDSPPGSPGRFGARRPFSGVLGLDPWRTDWSRPGLSFLSLVPRVAPTDEAPDPTRQPSDEAALAEVLSAGAEQADSPPEQERRVRELLAPGWNGPDSDRSTRTEPGWNPAPPAAPDTDPGRSVRSDAEAGPTRAGRDPSVAPADRSTSSAGDRGDGPGRGSTPSDDGDGHSMPAATDPASPRDSPTSDPEPVQFVPRRADTPAGPAPTEPRTDISERAAEPAGDPPSPTEARASSVPSERTDQSPTRPTPATDLAPASAEPPDREIDRPAMEPLRAPLTPPARWSSPPGEPGSAPERRSLAEADSAARRSDRSRPREDGATDRSVHGDPGSESTRPPTARSNDPRQLDDLVDVDRLADRLARVFERNSRIEQERRGR